ncbi:hypothetical protein [Spirosoma gilvum]
MKYYIFFLLFILGHWAMAQPFKNNVTLEAGLLTQLHCLDELASPLYYAGQLIPFSFEYQQTHDKFIHEITTRAALNGINTRKMTPINPTIIPYEAFYSIVETRYTHRRKIFVTETVKAWLGATLNLWMAKRDYSHVPTSWDIALSLGPTASLTYMPHRLHHFSATCATSVIGLISRPPYVLTGDESLNWTPINHVKLASSPSFIYFFADFSYEFLFANGRHSTGLTYHFSSSSYTLPRQTTSIISEASIAYKFFF